MTIHDAIERFVMQLEADGRAASTIAQRRRHIALLAHWWADVRPWWSKRPATRCPGVSSFAAQVPSRCDRENLRLGRDSSGICGMKWGSQLFPPPICPPPENMLPKAFLLPWILVATCATSFAGKPVDLSQAQILVTAPDSTILANAGSLLRDEIEARTRLALDVIPSAPEGKKPLILIGTEKELKARGYSPPSTHAVPRKVDGYALWTDSSRREAATVCAAGHDARGTLFAVGRLLRELDMDRDTVHLESDLAISTAPRYAIRGHQMAYRPKTNSYDGWNLEMWEQYYRDLIVFGTNAVELIPPSSDDVDDSPHFPKPKLEMMIAMSQLAADYGLELWIWNPLPRRLRHAKIDYADTAAVDAALVAWLEVFRALPRIDSIFVPGGDPGNVHPDQLLPLLERQKKLLNQYHPNAELWVSPQNFDRNGKNRSGWYATFIKTLQTDTPDWLDGVAFGPAVPVSLPELRRDVPAKYPVRRYPDITHASSAPYQVQDWDPAWVSTLGREPINPRPVAFAQIFRATQDSAVGFISYSEGCSDDVNKFVWSALGWDPEASIETILRDFSKYFISARDADAVTRGIFGLEKNWVGPLRSNETVLETLALFQELEKNATPQMKRNWRFQQALYRAYYDGYTKHRLLYELKLEARAMEVLGRAKELGVEPALEQAQAILEEATTKRIATDLRQRTFELAEALFQTIRMQHSVEKYASQRYANLDDIDVPLNDRVHLEEAFGEVRALDNEGKRIAKIGAIIAAYDTRVQAAAASQPPENWPDWTVEFDKYQRQRSGLFKPFRATTGN
jgi:hypothetical protein